MLSTKNHGLRETILFTLKAVALLLVICFAFEIPAAMFGKVLAAEKVYYVSEIKAFQAETEEEARKACEGEGYVCANKNLNAGTGNDAVLMGYKLTENKDEALYDVKLLHMNGGYQIVDYAQASAKMEKSNSGAAEAMFASASEFIINYNDGSPKAKEAYEGLNLFSVPEENNIKLGDFIVQGRSDANFFAKVITHASTGTVTSITNQLSIGLTPFDKSTDEKTGEEVDATWAGSVKESALWEIIESKDITQEELDSYDKDMRDDAQAFFKQLQFFATEYENGQSVYNEQQYVAEAQNTSISDAVENAEQASDADKAMTYVNAYETLNSYEAFEGMPLGEYLVEIGKKTSEEVDLRRLYPVLECMSYAQRKMIGMAGFLALITNLGKNEVNKQAETLVEEAKNKIKELTDTEAISVWANTDTDMASKKVAFTSTEIRTHSATQMVNSLAPDKWEEGKKITNDVFKWANVCLSAISVLTFLGGKYGITGAVIALAAAPAATTSAVTAAATTVLAVVTKISFISGIVSLILIGATLVWLLVSYIVDYIKRNADQDYTAMPDYTVDVRDVKGQSVNVIYKAVMDNRNKIADLNGYKAKSGWVCMFTSTDPNTGSPIRADENGNVFDIVYGDANKRNGYDCASFFGQISPGNCNTGARNDDVNGIYIHYYTESSMMNRAAPDGSGAGEAVSAGTKLYFRDIIVRSGETAEIAKSKIIQKEGFEIFDQNLSPDAREKWEKQSQFTFIGYKTTTDPKLAIRDIRVAPFTTSKTLMFGQISYGSAGTLGFPADSKDENKDYPADLDGLFYTTNENAGTPIEVGKLHLITDHSQAEPGWEPVTTFSGLPYNFNTTRYNNAGMSTIKPGRLRVYPFNYTGYASDKNYTWDNKKCYLYYEPEVKYTEGTKYLSGIFFGFGTESDQGETLMNLEDFFNTLSSLPNTAEADGSKGVNLAQSYFYKGYYGESNQKYLRLYYTWSYNPYRALTDVQTYRGEPYVSQLPYTLQKAISYPDKASASANVSATYAAATVVAERRINSDWVVRGLSPENAYMAPTGLLGANTQVSTGYTREPQGNFTFGHGQMPLLPTNLYVSGYVKDRPRLTLDSVVISQNRHDSVNNNGKITADVSSEKTLAGNVPEGDFNSVQELKDPYNLSAFNLSYPNWMDDEGEKYTEAELKLGIIVGGRLNDKPENYHDPGPSVFMYVKHEVVKKKYISRIFVGAAEYETARFDENGKPNDENYLKNFEKQADLNAMVTATAAGSDEMLPYDMSGEQSEAWYNHVKGGFEPEIPDHNDSSSYISVARTDDPNKAIRGIVLVKTNAKTGPEQLQIDGATYYCASNTAHIILPDASRYLLYYTYNPGVVPGKPITELDISEDVFAQGCSTVLLAQGGDTTEIINGKIETTEEAKQYGINRMDIFIHAKYETKTRYFEKIYAASGDTPKEAQLQLLEQGCTEFCDMDLNKGAGGKYVYFGYKGITLNEEKINSLATEEARQEEKNSRLRQAVYDIICTVGEEFHPEGILSDRYQIYYAPVSKKDKDGNLVGTNLNEGTTGPKIYMYYTTQSVATAYNKSIKGKANKKPSTMPMDYLESPITKIGFALYDYVPYSKELAAASSDNEDMIPWEYVMKSDNKSQVDLNEGAVKFDSDHLTTDDRITMFVQREDGNVKASAEITGGYNTALVTESKLYLNK